MTRGRSSTIVDSPIPGERPERPAPSKGGPGGPGRGPPKKPWKPYTFDKLEQISRPQLSLLKRLQWLLPDGLLTHDLSAPVVARLAKIFDDEVRLFVEYVHLAGPKALRKELHDPTFLGVLATSPHSARGLIEVELSLAHNIIDTLLGGAQSEGGLVRPLTDIEDGVLSYVLIEAFKALSPVAEPGRNRLRLERTLKGLEEGLDLLAEESAIAVVEFKALLGLHAGYIRILLPGSSVASAMPPEDGPVRRARRLKQIEKSLSLLSGVKAFLRAEIGHTELTVADLRGLGAGDVLLIDALTTRSDLGEGGTASLRIGAGRKGSIDAEISLVDGRYQAKVVKVVLGPSMTASAPDEEAAARLAEAPPEEDDAEVAPPRVRSEFDDPEEAPAKPKRGRALHDEDDSSTTNPGLPTDDWERDHMSADSIKEDAAELLNDVPLQIAVELARVPITAEGVVSLHVGKVLELGCAPGEPVDLSVNGKVVARGELVEIEGQLGVRILSIAG